MNKTEFARFRDWKRRAYDITDEVIEKIMEVNYNSLLPKSKEYVKSLIKTYKRSLNTKGLSSIIVKEDLLDEYRKSRLSSKFLPNYDFSLVPDIIKDKRDKFLLISHDTICGIEIGTVETCFHSLIELKREPIFNKTYEKYTNAHISVNNLSKIDNFINRATNIYKENLENFDLSSISFSDDFDIPIKIHCKNCNRSFWVRPTDFLKGKGCPHCNRLQKAAEASIPFEKFKQMAVQKRGNSYDYSLAESEYKNFTSGLISIKCNSCGTIFYQSPIQHITSKYPCPDCRKSIISNNSFLDKSEILRRLIKICGPDYDFSNSHIVDRQTPIEFIHIPTGKKILQKPVNIFTGGSIDPDDYLPLGENLIVNWLRSQSSNLEFVHRQVIKGKIMGRSKLYVEIDFSVTKDKKVFYIEANGCQHYDESHFIGLGKISSSVTKYTFKQQLTRDRNVKQYCLDNNITFIEIPYTYFTYKKIDDILTRIILNNESPDFIEIPEIKYC